MGVEVPITVTSFSKSDDAKSGAVTSFQYKNVGTNIDCWAEDRSGDGLFQVGLSVENSSIYSSTEARTTGGLNETGLAPDRPISAPSTSASTRRCATARASRRWPRPTPSPARS